jgi:molybdopterin-guanine dinucleotide biosynthesis protein A
MGRDKALLPVAGVPMARRVADALHAAGAHSVHAQGGDAPALEALGLVVRPDVVPGGGPLPATLQALDETGTEVVVILSCDLLRPSAAAVAATVEALLAAPEAVGAVPVVDGHRQWTHAAWRRSARAGLRAGQRTGVGSLQRAAADLPLVDVPGLDPAAVADADRPEDLGG